MRTNILAAVLAAAATPVLAEPSIQDLSWLIGKWNFRDAATEAVGSNYVEAGERECAWALDRAYVRCESRGVSNGKARTYVFYINHYRREGRFEMLSMWANAPHKDIRPVTVSADGRQITSLGEPYEEDGKRWRSWSVITYDGANGYVWENGRQEDASGAERGPVRYRDVVTRVK